MSLTQSIERKRTIAPILLFINTPIIAADFKFSFNGVEIVTLAENGSVDYMRFAPFPTEASTPSVS